MRLRGDITCRVHRHTACVDATLGRTRVHTPLHVVDALRDLRARKHLVVEEGHIRVLMTSATLAATRVHSLRVEHEILRL